MNISEDTHYSRSITLTLTNNCNLCCSYCFEHEKSNERMSFETAKAIIDKELPREVNSEETFYIELFGGEPFLEFELIKQIYDYVLTTYPKINWIMFSSTNGTLVHGEIQEWLKKSCRFVCGLSLDGNKAMHDINRSNSFDLIDLDFFIKQYPTQSVKMTISLESLPMLCDGIKFLHEKGFLINCNLAYGIDWSDDNNLKILERELTKLVDFYIENPNLKPCSMLELPIIQLGIPRNKNTIHKFCGTGTHMTAYYIDGTPYPCHFFTPMSIGDELSKQAKKIDFCTEISIDDLDKKCINCPIVDSCPSCYGSNYLSTGNIYLRDENLCKLTKVIFKARSYYRAKQWELGQLKLSEAEEYALLKSILILQDDLQL